MKRFPWSRLQLDAGRRIRHVLLAVEHDQLAFADPALGDRRGRRHLIGDRDVRLALVELAQQIVVMDGLQVELHIFVGAQEARDRGRNGVERERGQRRDAQRSADAAAQVPPRLAQGMDPVLDLADLGEQDMRILGRHQPAIGALEQLEAEQAFGVAQHLRDRRLRHVERPRRGADRTVDVDGVENLDVAQVHVGMRPIP